MPVTLLSGVLGRVHLSGVLQLAESEELTGVLTLPGAQLQFLDGEIVGAQGRYGCVGVVAVRDAFLGSHGAFSFVAQTVDAQAHLGDVQMLILDGCRVADDWERLAPQRLRPTPELRLSELEQPLRGVVQAMDGQAVVAELLAQAELSPARVTDSLGVLLEQRLLESVGAAPERVPVTRAVVSSQWDGLDEYELLERGRLHVKRGELEQAQGCFERAQEIAPGNRLVRQNLKRLRAMQESPRRRS